MTERPSPLERLSTALNSSDLTVDADHRGDVDYVLALGFLLVRPQGLFGEKIIDRV